MSVEALKSFFDVGTVVLLFLTFAFGAGVLITGNIINARQAEHLRQFDKDLTVAKTELGEQQERAAKAEKDAAEAKTTSAKTNERATVLEKNAADARAAQQKVEIELARQRELTAKAERNLLELQERLKPRRLTDKQSADFVAVLKTLPKARLKLGYTAGGGDEAFNLLKQLLPLFREAKWDVPEALSEVSNHFDIQVIGVALLIPGPEGSDPRKPEVERLIQLNATEAALQKAFKAVGMDLEFQRWFPNADGTPELVVGSKPDPT